MAKSEKTSKSKGAGSSSISSTISSKQGKKMNGAQAVVASLEAQGCTTIFGYPGGQAIKIYDALYDSKQLHHVLARHEQAAVHAADGYARATGKVGVVIVTSGPGATNTVTGIATAYMDSVPLVVVTAQVPRGIIGTDSFQESDIVGITMPVVKHSYLVQSTAELTRTFREAFHIASSGRPGPVLIDIPSDILAAQVVFNYPTKINMPSYKPTYKGNKKQIRGAVKKITHAKKPILYVGGGVISSNAEAEVLKLSDAMQIPIVTTLMGKGSVSSSNPLNFGLVGMHGSKYANVALSGADLIIACGARFSDRVTGKVSEFAKGASVIHIDIDPAEIGKVVGVDTPIVGNLKGVLAEINAAIAEAGAKPQSAKWVEEISALKKRYPLYTTSLGDDTSTIVPEVVIHSLSQKLDPNNSIVVTEVGQHQMWAAQLIERTLPRTFISSGGLGTMGFGFPAAIGVAFGVPKKQVVCIAGDGSFQMNSQEMATAAINNIPVKVIVLDNRALGMVHQWQKLFYGKRFSQTELSANPDFVKLAAAYNWQAKRVEKPEDVDAALDEMLEAKGPYLLDVAIPLDQNVFPMVAPGTAVSDAFGAIDVDAGAVRVGLNEEGEGAK